MESHLCQMKTAKLAIGPKFTLGVYTLGQYCIIRVMNSFKSHKLFCVWSHSLLLAPETHILSPWGHYRERLTPRGSAGLNIPEWVWHYTAWLTFKPHFFPLLFQQQWLWIELFSPLHAIRKSLQIDGPDVFFSNLFVSEVVSDLRTVRHMQAS